MDDVHEENQDQLPDLEEVEQVEEMEYAHDDEKEDEDEHQRQRNPAPAGVQPCNDAAVFLASMQALTNNINTLTVAVNEQKTAIFQQQKR